MAVIGVAEVLVTPSFKDLQTTTGKAFSGLSSSTIPTKTGKGMGGVLSDAFGTALGIGIAKFSASAMGNITDVFTRGFARMNAIDTAQAKLRGLGHDADAVEKIMENASASVKGTAFGLGDAATAAAGAVAAGIQPGEELERVMKAVSNSAAASGSSMGEMGAIFNKVAGSNKAQNDSLAQVADRGIPIYKALAEIMGVTQAEVFDLASKGEIDFALFEQAMTKASGTVAAEMGKTLPGAIDNLGAAKGRLGETILRAFQPAMVAAVASSTAFFDALNAGAKVVMPFVSTALTGLVDVVARGKEIIGGAFEFIGAAWQVVVNTINGTFDPWEPLYAYGIVEDSDLVYFLVSVGDLLRTLWDIAKQAGGFVVTQLQTLAGMFMAGGAAAGGFGATLLGLAQGAFVWVTEGTRALTGFLQEHQGVVSTVLGILGTGVTILAGVSAGLAAISGVVGIVTGIVAKLVPIVSAVLTGFKMLGAFFLANPFAVALAALAGIALVVKHLWDTNEGFRAAMTTAWTAISQFIATAWTTWIQPALQAMSTWITGTLAPAISGFWTGTVQPAFAAIGAFVASTWSGVILPALQGMWSWITGTLAPMFLTLWTQYVQPAFAGIAAAVQHAWVNIGPALMSIASSVSGFASGLMSFLAPAIGLIISVGGKLANLLGPILGAAFNVAVTVVMTLVGAFVHHLGGAISSAIRVVTALVQFIAAIFRGDWAAAWNAAKDLAVNAFKLLWHTVNVILTVNLLGAIRSGVAAMLGLFRGGMSSITGLFSAGWNAVVGLVKGAWSAITGAARSGASGMTSLVRGLSSQVGSLFSALGSRMLALMRAAWAGLKALFTNGASVVRNGVSNLVSRIGELFRSMGSRMRELSSAAWARVKELFTSGIGKARQAVVDGRDKIVGIFKEMPTRFKNALGNLGNFLKDSGKALLRGFSAGISAGFDKAKQMAKDGLSKIRNLFPFSPAKEGPFSGRGYTTYSGQALMRDFAAAIGDAAPEAADQAARALEAARDALSGDLALASLARGPAGTLPAGLHAALYTPAPTAAPTLRAGTVPNPAGGFPEHVTLVVEGGPTLRAYVQDVGDERLASHVAGLEQPVRQRVGAL